MRTFKIGQTYKGTSGVGEIAITIVKRTPKTLVVKTSFGENRVRISKQSNEHEEIIFFKSWIAGATDNYSKEQQIYDSNYASYYR